MNQYFLVRWGDQFLHSWKGGRAPVWVDVPSKAAHFSYDDADSTAQDVQAMGIECVVTDILGRACTLKVIQRQMEYVGGDSVVLATEPGYDDELS